MRIVEIEDESSGKHPPRDLTAVFFSLFFIGTASHDGIVTLNRFRPADLALKLALKTSLGSENKAVQKIRADVIREACTSWRRGSKHWKVWEWNTLLWTMDWDDEKVMRAMDPDVAENGVPSSLSS